MIRKHLCLSLIFFQTLAGFAQTTALGSGGYTNSFPGVDSANRNSYPSGVPQLSGNAQNKPAPTNDWWSFLLKEDHVANLFNYPLTLKTTPEGLVMTYIPFGVIGDQESILIGLENLNSTKATVSDHSDWTVTMSWENNSHHLTATSGVGMPFVYFTKETNDLARVEIKAGNITVLDEMLVIQNAQHEADYVVYAPSGSTWNRDGQVFTSTLNNKNYWSAAMLPQTANNALQVAQSYQKYAYVFPTNTTANWDYDENTGVLRTDFTIQTDTKEGEHSTLLQGLLPHQWAHLAADSPRPALDTYTSIRGDLKMLDGTSFSVENTFKGILPTLPYLANYSPLFNPSSLNEKIDLLKNDGLNTWTDSYNEGQMMNRLIQTARIADQTGNTSARDLMIATVKERLEDWLRYQSGEVAFLFYYNKTWSTLFGYPAGHGQDNNINDHHFHWGYFIHAAAFIEQFHPGWAEDWGAMVNLLIKDAASDNRNDSQFPFLRNFSPYAGHAWANGFASFPQGNDQESTSESMQFNSSLIHWGTVTKNDAIRDLGIYLYTTEQSAIEEYWFDIKERIFSDSYPYGLASRVWGNSYDSGTFWTADIAAAYGIEMYPMHGGSLYLGHHLDYVEKLWEEITRNTGILSKEENPNLWHDVFWQYASFIDPDLAISLYDSYPERGLKFGISDAQTYHWLHNMKALGTVNSSLTANHPIASVFDNDGTLTYVAHNYSDAPITVTFSDGFSLDVPAHKMATNRDVTVGGTLRSDFDRAHPGGNANLVVETTGSGVEKVEFYKGTERIGLVTSPPYQIKASNLALGIQDFYAKIHTASAFTTTNSISIKVGEQEPYSTLPIEIPGTLEAGHFDVFKGGSGQNIAYYDTSVGNNGMEYGDFRKNEYVDTVLEDEGATVGWIDAGEWLTYSIVVKQSGYYSLDLRYAADNTNGGPFHLEIDGKRICNDITVGSTGGWDKWRSKSVQNIELIEGAHILKLVFSAGGFNLGKMTFSHQSQLNFTPLVLKAGNDLIVQLPVSTCQIDGSESVVPDPEHSSFQWEQVYGPSVVSFSDDKALVTEIDNLEEGVYKLKLSGSDDNTNSEDSVLIIVRTGSNLLPSVALTTPSNNQTFVEGESITINAVASDLDGNIDLVEFFNGGIKIGESLSEPYQLEWETPENGTHVLTAKATDNAGESTQSDEVTITVNQKMSCDYTSSTSTEGQFSKGYQMTFETIGNQVQITCQLLDTDKAGVVGILFRQDPFGETYMDAEGGQTFSKTIGGLTIGETIRYACKFAFAGGMAVTEYFDYKVGESCQLSVPSFDRTHEIKLFPNPVGSTLYVEVTPSADDVRKIELFSSTGKAVKTVQSNAKNIDVGGLDSGIYFVKIHLKNKGYLVRKFIKK